MRPTQLGGLLVNRAAHAASVDSSSGSDGGGAAGSRPEEWLDLLQTPEPDMFGSRARSASDAAVLRRKGHLKEQDKFIQFVLDMHQTHTSLEVGALGSGLGIGSGVGRRWTFRSGCSAGGAYDSAAAIERC